MTDTQTEFQTVRALLDSVGAHPKRAFGQNFLIDRGAIGDIVSLFDFSAYDTVVEIGPGLGALTLPIAKQAKRLIAVEADRDMVTLLTKRLAGADNVTIVASPFEHWDHQGIEEKLAVIGNLPYNLTTKLLELAVQMKAQTLGFMVQREVADKLTYNPKRTDCSPLALYLHLLGGIAASVAVPRGCFYPVPGVDSTFIAIEVKQNIPFTAYLGFKKLLLTPNKKLANVLPQVVADPEKRAQLMEQYAELMHLRARQVAPEKLLPLALSVGGEKIQ